MTSSSTPELPAEQPSQHDGAPQAPELSYRRTSVVGNFIRGALIGAVETVPGVSGGTVALVVGIYHHIIDSAAAAISAVRHLMTGPNRVEGFKHKLSEVHWKVVLPVAVGMVLAVFTIAGPMANAVVTYPVQMRALFFGMVMASVAVPVRMILQDLRIKRTLARWRGADTTTFRLRPWHGIAALAAAVVTFLLVSLPPTDVEPSPWILLPAAAVAVSALVLPGLSGSFLLLTFGLYEPTLRAVEQRDIGYLAIFMLGMMLGMIVVVKLLRWLLEHHHTVTLAVLTGVMVGGLRTLWPWQDDTRQLAGPGEDALLAAGLAVIGFVVVIALVIIDTRIARRDHQAQLPAPSART